MENVLYGKCMNTGHNVVKPQIWQICATPVKSFYFLPFQQMPPIQIFICGKWKFSEMITIFFMYVGVIPNK